MDVAASEFHKEGKYDLDFKNPKSNPADWISSEKLCEMYQGFIKDAPVISIEDPFDQVGLDKVAHTAKCRENCLFLIKE